MCTDPQDLNDTGAPEEGAPEEDAAVWKDRCLRATADLRNLSNRTAREIEMSTRRERGKLLGEFMKVIDNLERALVTKPEQSNPWYEGMAAIHDQMIAVMARNGAVPFDSAGEPFDPNRHEATGSVVVPGVDAGTIVEVLERGYEDEHGEVLRPARVIVAQAPGE